MSGEKYKKIAKTIIMGWMVVVYEEKNAPKNYATSFNGLDCHGHSIFLDPGLCVILLIQVCFFRLQQNESGKEKYLSLRYGQLRIQLNTQKGFA